MWQRNKRVDALRAMVMVTPSICTERMKYYTESWRSSEAYSVVVRRALALREVLRNIPVNIYPGELIVGCHTSKVRGGALLPEIRGEWILDELDTVSERQWEKYSPLETYEKEVIKKYLPYWVDKSLSRKWEMLVPEQYAKFEGIIQTGGLSRNGHYPGHFSMDYEKVIKQGLKSTIADIDRKLNELSLIDPENIEKINFYTAAKIGQEAILEFADRYRKQAYEMALTEQNSSRKQELFEISRICGKVPAYPAESFYEALECVWLVSICAMNECWGAGCSLGRLDQYLYPYYRKDIAEGIISRDEAIELLALLFVKMNDVINLQAGFLQVGFTGYPVMQGLTIGGVDCFGNDAVNDLTYAILEAENAVGLSSEEIVVRVSDNNPIEYLTAACEVAKNLCGKLKFVSDSSTIAALTRFKIPMDKARNYVSCACHKPIVPAFNHNMCGVIFNYPLALELALNNGVHKLSGLRIGPETGNAADFSSLSDLEEAFYKQFKNMLEISYVYNNADMYLYATYMPCPMISSFYGPCYENATDVFDCGTAPYHFHDTALCGVPNVVDSFAAIQKVIFEDRFVTMAELIDALDCNFNGYDKLLAKLKAAPKFGNDDNYADHFACDLLHDACSLINEGVTYHGRRNVVACVGMTVNIPYGELLSATPDGRKKGEPLSEGGISPYQGRNTNGITATLNSVSKIDHREIEGGSVLNVRISNTVGITNEKLKLLALMIKTFCKNGGNLVQFNFISTDVLRKAQKEPDEYRDLLIRVATYSAFFVELSPVLQENIIERYEMEL